MLFKEVVKAFPPHTPSLWGLRPPSWKRPPYSCDQCPQSWEFSAVPFYR